MVQPVVRKQDLVEPELSYRIVGAILDVYHGLGAGLKESTYQKALALAFKERGISFQEQLYCPVRYRDTIVGPRYFDFLVEEKIVVELKCDKRVVNT